MYSILRILILSELKFVIISLFMLTFFTGRAVEDKNKLQLYPGYSRNIGNIQTIKISSNEPFLQSGIITGTREETDSLESIIKDTLIVLTDSSYFEGMECKNPSTAQGSVNAFNDSFIQYSSIPIFQSYILLLK